MAIKSAPSSGLSRSLPTPTVAEQTHSLALQQRIHAAITHHSGYISFRHFMQMALYEPGLGYYVAGQHKLGAAGDFVTAPEISPLFSRCLANQCARVLRNTPGQSILEFGAGSGVMAADILLQLEALQQLPAQYLILELSPELQQRQCVTLQQKVPHLLTQVKWLQQLPQRPFQGVVLANEVLDAMPVELFSIIDGRYFPVNVITDTTDLHHPTGFELVAATGDDTGASLPAGLKEKDWRLYPSPYISEYNPNLPAWVNSLAEILQQGLIVLIDYGYDHNDYYRPERDRGTLLCHYRHHVHDDALFWPGLQDITASVDFSTVADAAENAGLEVSGYTTQADFLFNNGLEPLFNQALTENPQQQYALAQQVRRLTLPGEMGERFKVISLTKGFTPADDRHTLGDFLYTDQRHRL